MLVPAPQEISAPQLDRLIGTPKAPVIIDVVIDQDFALCPRVIPGAIRLSHRDLSGMLAHLKSLGPAQGLRVVVTCQKGKKLSQGVVAWLRSHGIAAEYLSGGMVDWVAGGFPAIPFDHLPTQNQTESLWVTRHRPKIDRISCPWLIRRFIDPAARFLFVAPSEVTNVAEKFGAIPFDVEGVEMSHRGDLCTFDTMLDHYGLNTPALTALARIVRAADTNRHDLAPEAAGLLAVSIGLSRMYRDDTEQLNAGMAIYDALYRWARDGQGETHDWAGRAK